MKLNVFENQRWVVKKLRKWDGAERYKLPSISKRVSRVTGVVRKLNLLRFCWVEQSGNALKLFFKRGIFEENTRKEPLLPLPSKILRPGETKPEEKGREEGEGLSANLRPISILRQLFWVTKVDPTRTLIHVCSTQRPKGYHVSNLPSRKSKNYQVTF